MLLMVVPDAPEPTCTTKVKLAVVFAASVPMLAVTVPVAPTAVVLVVQPDGAENDTNVVLAGRHRLVVCHKRKGYGDWNLVLG